MSFLLTPVSYLVGYAVKHSRAVRQALKVGPVKSLDVFVKNGREITLAAKDLAQGVQANFKSYTFDAMHYLFGWTGWVKSKLSRISVHVATQANITESMRNLANKLPFSQRLANFIKELRPTV